MKVFVSSVIRGMESLRDAAGAGIRLLGHELIRAEDFGALAETPQQACLAGVRRADAVVLVLGSRYGDPHASGLSATHEEYREARERCPILAFVQKGMNRDQREEELLREVQAWGSGHLTHSFDSPNELRDAVVQALHGLELSRASGMVDEQELLGRARKLVPERRGPVDNCLCVVVAAGPTQQVLRPAELESASLQDDILREALLGEYRVLDDRYGTERSIHGDRLIFNQKYGSLLVTEQGAIRILAQAGIDHSATSFGLPAIVEEDILQKIERGFCFCGKLLDRIDPVHRLSDVVPVVALVGGTYIGWQTRSERAANPHVVSVTSREEVVTQYLSPARRHRAALTQDAGRIAEDLTVRLRRAVGP